MDQAKSSSQNFQKIPSCVESFCRKQPQGLRQATKKKHVPGSSFFFRQDRFALMTDIWLKPTATWNPLPPPGSIGLRTNMVRLEAAYEHVGQSWRISELLSPFALLFLHKVQIERKLSQQLLTSLRGSIKVWEDVEDKYLVESDSRDRIGSEGTLKTAEWLTRTWEE